ncbi:hypothetical protein M569_16438, partial [Genlisea aurea]
PMQSLLLPVARSAAALPIQSSFPSSTSSCKASSPLSRNLPVIRHDSVRDLHSPLKLQVNSYLQSVVLSYRSRKIPAASPAAAGAYSPITDESEKAKLAQVSRRLETTSRYFKRLGSFGFWGQLICTLVAAVILSFSTIVTGKITSPATFYATAAGIAAAFVSVFWSFGYIRLSNTLSRTARDPSKAPARADVIRSLKNGIIVNLLGLGAAILGMQATVGLLVAKALTTSTTPYYQGIPPGTRPVLALDIFLIQACANTILSHFLGLSCTMELLRSVTMPESVPVP